MKLMLTSFGFDIENKQSSNIYSLFSGMPPTSMALRQGMFIPDYTTFLLCEKIIIDKTSYLMMTNEENLERWKMAHPYSDKYPYHYVVETLKLLFSEGFVEIVDFYEIIAKHRTLLNKMLEHDLQKLEVWVRPFIHSALLWNEFTEKLVFDGRVQSSAQVFNKKNIPEQSYFSEMLDFYGEHTLLHFTLNTVDNVNDLLHRIKEKQNIPDNLVQNLKTYLTYANANIILSLDLGVGFHDWADYEPVYKMKFSPMQEQEKSIDASKKLFTIAFPEFKITDSKTLISLITDRRIVELRSLIEEAAKGKIEFDDKFAASVFKEVYNIERRSSKYRSIASYLTLPIDILPVPGTGLLQKIMEETSGTLLDRRLKEKYQWFYMLSDFTGKKRNSFFDSMSDFFRRIKTIM